MVRLSAKISFAPRISKASAVETNVYDGIITSSPGWMSRSRADISRASVHEVVRSIFEFGESWMISSKAVACFVNGPSPENRREAIAADILVSSAPVEYARLKLIKIHQYMV